MSIFSKQLRQNPELIPTSMKTRIAYDVSGNAEYIGIANVGTADADPGWQIKELTYDASDNITAINYANDASGEINDFVHIWNDHATLVYGVVP